MAQRLFKIIVACIVTLASANAYGQEQTKNTLISKREIPSVTIRIPSAYSALMNLAQAQVLPGRQLDLSKASAGRIPLNYYVQQFGFVCKKELQVQKVTRMPFYFRLGSLAYCNYLEAK